MASRDLKDLVPEASEKALLVQQASKEAVGFDLLIYCTLRPLEEQARLFRQSRSRKEIDARMEKMIRRGFDYLANVIESVGPCYGRHVTNAASGESWHNYGETVRLVVEIGLVDANITSKLSEEAASKIALMRMTTRYWSVRCMVL